MENFNEDCKSLKDIIDFEFKTADDYVKLLSGDTSTV